MPRPFWKRGLFFVAKASCLCDPVPGVTMERLYLSSPFLLCRPGGVIQPLLNSGLTITRHLDCRHCDSDDDLTRVILQRDAIAADG